MDEKTVRWRRADVLAVGLLLAATMGVYAQTAGFGYVNYDDPEAVSQNVHVREGLSASNVSWAFMSRESANWMPLTRLSWLAETTVLGGGAGSRHIDNALLHAFAAVLLFAALRRTTGARWRSAFVAAVFALHPLHVESVAWIVERKDVLCAFFWCLTLLLYARYVERPGVLRYLLVLAAFAASLLSKPMAVTLPLVLLLLDRWPLRRWAFAEKLPMLALSVVASWIAIGAQSAAGALAAAPLALRLDNAILSAGVYIAQAFWPLNLAVFYPYALISGRELLAAAAVVGGVSIAAVFWMDRLPYLTTGWFWYLVTLGPVLGLVTIGEAAHADRYTYLPMIGVTIALAWGAAELVERWPKLKSAAAGAGVAVCIACALISTMQVSYWRDSVSLFRHAAEVTEGNYLAWNNFGTALLQEGKAGEAIECFRKAVRIQPHFVGALDNLSEVLRATGQAEEALRFAFEAVNARPNSASAHQVLARALERAGRTAEAAVEYGEAARLQAVGR